MMRLGGDLCFCIIRGQSFLKGSWMPLERGFSSLSHYVKDIKQTFSRIYNGQKKRKGTLWGERFKSVIVEKGSTVINCLAYIDLNAVRAGIVKRPEDYRWCSIGYHVQAGNKDDFLSLDFGLARVWRRGFSAIEEISRVSLPFRGLG